MGQMVYLSDGARPGITETDFLSGPSPPPISSSMDQEYRPLELVSISSNIIQQNAQHDLKL